jgi:signal transduction histidine kinase
LRRLWQGRKLGAYAAVTGAAFLLALVAGWNLIGTRIDDYAYDLLLEFNPPPAHQAACVVVAIDEATLNHEGGLRVLRTILANGLEIIAKGRPTVVAIDVALADTGDPEEDRRLAGALADTHNLVLPAEFINDARNRRWENPLPRFARLAAAVGNVRADEESHDGVTRSIALEKTFAHERHWALALEAFRLARGVRRIVESPREIQVGSETIPFARVEKKGEYHRSLRIRYTVAPLPKVSLEAILRDPALAAQLRGKTVFFGVTATNDRVVTPYGQLISGVEAHAQLFETLESGQFLRDASGVEILGWCLLIAALAAAIFAYTSGWRAYALGALVLVLAHALPVMAFRHNVVFPYSAPFAVAWLCVSAAASYQHFFVRRQLQKSEGDRQRYQQAIRFVTHEMKTPLTAIQGSSELMGRYNLTEDKRKQMAAMINAESKRLARMIQTFLDVERLSEGEMELKREVFPVSGVIGNCLSRIAPVAERKNIATHAGEIADVSLTGDRELMEYAVYNLLTNAVKYSSAGTEVFVAAVIRGDRLHVSVRDQGMGLDEKELRSIFRKFYRTKRAEASGESGTGIGLSIVEQIVTHHGGRMEVTSEVGKGSCFTIVTPYAASPAVPRQPAAATVKIEE